MSPSYAVRVAENPEDRDACSAVRKEVFVVEQGVPQDIAYDAGAVHVLAVRDDGTPLGTGRLLYGEGAAAKTDGDLTVGSLGRLAMTCEARGLGVGGALVGALEEAARARGLAAVDLHAQTHVLGFYERLGYVAYGAEFPDAGIPHRAMWRPL